MKCPSTTCDITHHFHRSCINEWLNYKWLNDEWLDGGWLDRKKDITCSGCKHVIKEDAIYDLVKNPALELLFKAIEAGDVERVQIYVKNTPSILDKMYSFKNIHGDIIHATPLCYAIFCNSVPIVRALLNCNNVNTQDEDGNTPLHRTAEHYDIDILEILLSVDGIDINKQNEDGDTPLHLELIPCYVVDYVEDDINSNKQNEDTEHTLISNHDIVKILLDRTGIDVNKQNHKGESPFHIACMRNPMTIVKIFLEKPGSIDINKQIQDLSFLSGYNPTA